MIPSVVVAVILVYLLPDPVLVMVTAFVIYDSPRSRELVLMGQKYLQDFNEKTPDPAVEMTTMGKGQFGSATIGRMMSKYLTKLIQNKSAVST
jgi:hypothetical protein